MIFSLAALRKSLSECHLTNQDKFVKLLKDVKDPEYFLHRILECISQCREGEDVLDNTRMGIQLFNLYRVAYYERLQAEGNKEGRAGSNNSGSDNSGNEGGSVGSDPNARERIPNGTS